MSSSSSEIMTRPRARNQYWYIIMVIALVLCSSTLILYLQLMNERSESEASRAQSQALVNDIEIFGNSPSFCPEPADSDESSSLVVFLVHSARHHVQYRRRIRETWGSVSRISNWELRVVFLIGFNKAGALGDYLDTEARLHRDMLIGSFHDTYRNLTLKHLLGYTFVLEHCKSATFVIKLDDDMFVHPYNLITLLDKQRQALNNNILCNEGNRIPQRGHAGFVEKWHVTREEYPDDLYPHFCLGAAYITTPAIMRKIYSVRGRAPFFWIDDIFVTGVLRAYYTENVATKKSELIGVKDVKRYFELQHSNSQDHAHAHWQSHKIFYLLKVDSMDFDGMNRFWKNVLAHRNDSINA